MWNKLRSERGEMDADGAVFFVILFCFLFLVGMGVETIISDNMRRHDHKLSTRELKVQKLEETFPGVDFTLSRTHTAVASFADPPHNKVSCRVHVDGYQYANRYEINVDHQRGLCHKALVVAQNKGADD